MHVLQFLPPGDSGHYFPRFVVLVAAREHLRPGLLTNYKANISNRIFFGFSLPWVYAQVH